MKTTPTRHTRRQFLTRAATVIGAPMIIPGGVLGLNGQTAPSNKITMAVFGWGMMGPGNTNDFMGQPDCQILAACDIDSNALAAALGTINKRQGADSCKGFKDYREVMARKDIDTAMIALPDHWHALAATEALKNGKDVYGEKPLAKTIAEQQAIVKAVQANKRIWQTGSWQRSISNFHKAVSLVRNGYIGKIQKVEVGLPSGHNDFAGTKDKRSVTPPPANLDYETWIGPSTMMDYIECRVHKNWRWNYNTGGGQLLDWIGHHCDIAHWGMDADGTGPVEIEGQGEFPAPTEIWNTCTKYRIESKYASGIAMTIAGGHKDIRSGTKWIGDNGWIWVDRGGFDASNPEWKTMKLPADLKTPVFNSPGHHRNFLDCVKSRQPTITPAETAHRSAIPGHLGLIAMQVGRKIKWDPAKEVIIGDEEASKRLTREYRGPWKMPS